MAGTPAKSISILAARGEPGHLVISIAMLGVADLLRRRGEGLFQEASNLFQKLEAYPVPGSFPEEVTVDARLGLRSFSSTADLPLARGRYGAAVYAAVSVVIVLIAAILYSQSA